VDSGTAATGAGAGFAGFVATALGAAGVAAFAGSGAATIGLGALTTGGIATGACGALAQPASRRVPSRTRPALRGGWSRANTFNFNYKPLIFQTILPFYYTVGRRCYHCTVTSESIVRSGEWQSWLQEPAGQYLLRWEQAQLDTMVSDLFGYHAVELALPGLDALRASRIGVRASAVLSGEAFTLGIGEGRVALWVEDFEDLPFASDSLDLIVLPHALEFAADPHRVLREVERVLRPEGRVVVSGMNPYSLWGVRQALKPVLGQYLPTEGEFISLPRLRDWFRLLSLDLDKGHFGGFAWPVRSENLFARMGPVESFGDRFWPICGAFYLVSGVKRVRGMRLLGPAWQRGRVRGARAAIAAPTSHHQDKGA
jgi:SAM-dependent methyltransferase